MTIKAEIQDMGLLATYARLKNIPLAKVLRNAARDFVQGAAKATPTGRLGKSPFVRILVEGTKRTFRYIPWDSLDDKAQRRLRKHRVPMRRGWSKASWIHAMRVLGMTGRDGQLPTAKKSLPKAVETLSAIGGDRTNEIVITDEIHFDARPGEIDRITEAGFALASKRLTTDFRKIMKAAQNGGKPNL